jgi:hypothetical protein
MANLIYINPFRDAEGDAFEWAFFYTAAPQPDSAFKASLPKMSRKISTPMSR